MPSKPAKALIDDGVALVLVGLLHRILARARFDFVGVPLSPKP